MGTTSVLHLLHSLQDRALYEVYFLHTRS